MLSGAEDPRDTFAIRQEADALSQDGAESDFEWLARMREHFHDATALAEAEARGRRQGLEEAAKNDHSKDFQLLLVRIIQRHRNGRDLAKTLEGAADLLKRKGSLSPFRATVPTEAQKPEEIA